MAGERQKLWKKLRSELASTGVSTKSVTSEDGSSLSLRSAGEMEELLDLAAEEDARAAGGPRIRMFRRKGPPAYGTR